MTKEALRTIDRPIIVLGGAAILASVILRLATLGQPLVEAHAFRQTQTAYTAVIYHREGIDLTRTPLPIFGPPWSVPFEFPLFQAIAAIVMDLGAPIEFALRATSLAFFVVSAWILWLIVTDETDRRSAVFTIAAYTLAPLVMLWSRTSMIETLAVAAALGTVHEALSWDRTGSRPRLALAVGLAILAAVLKITTALIWVAPALVLLHRSRLASGAIVGASLVAGLAWTTYADMAKAASPATAFLTSDNLRDWNFGSIAQRLDPATWTTILGWIAGIGLLIFLAPLVVRRSRIGAWALLTFILGPLIFTNLYVEHDYYWMAVAPAGAILVGLVAGALLEIDAASGRRRGLIAIVLLTAASFVAYPRWTAMFGAPDPDGVLPQAAQIRAASAPSDLIAIDQNDWSPAVLFYADRRGYMEYEENPPAPDGYIKFRCPEAGKPGPCVRLGTTGTMTD